MKTPLLATLLFVALSSINSSAQSMFDRVNDFDGDGRADFAITRDENGLKKWHIWRSTAGYMALQWGIASDIPAAGDYDGDGRTDIAVARLSVLGGNRLDNTTYYLASGNGSVGIASIDANYVVGAGGPVNQDYDGDGRADVALFQWHGVGFLAYRPTSTGSPAGVTLEWFQVKVGDISGNQAADVVSHDISANEITVVQGGGQTIRWGSPGDRFLPADFDGDNKGDIVIFRPTTGDWWWMRSSDGVVNVLHWGLNGDTPVPADYDGDGRTDHAVYRAGSPNGIYYVRGSTNGFQGFAWGIVSDVPVTY